MREHREGLKADTEVPTEINLKTIVARALLSRNLKGKQQTLLTHLSKQGSIMDSSQHNR